jgi:hypothetical protein
MLVVELMKMFNEEGIILQSKVEDPEPTSMLWPLYTSFLFNVSSPETLFPDAINVLYNTTRQFDCAHGVSDDGCDCSVNYMKSA